MTKGYYYLTSFLDVSSSIMYFRMNLYNYVHAKETEKGESIPRHKVSYLVLFVTLVMFIWFQGFRLLTSVKFFALVLLCSHLPFCCYCQECCISI